MIKGEKKDSLDITKLKNGQIKPATSLPIIVSDYTKPAPAIKIKKS